MENRSIEKRKHHPLMKIDNVPDIAIHVEELPAEESGPETIRMPLTDLLEQDDAVVLYLDIPGVDRKDIELTAERNSLSVRAPLKRYSIHGHNKIYTEYEGGSYERTFMIDPNVIDANHIEASLNVGVLQIILPRKQAYRSKKIMIQSG
ncbi:MAG: Hsp20/alpha crystallin family protein [Sedimentisphaerales bacterium]|nr:Hsp20/alpha crystallin family protein [Sedimentisphaerales bacterium]